MTKDDNGRDGWMDDWQLTFEADYMNNLWDLKTWDIVPKPKHDRYGKITRFSKFVTGTLKKGDVSDG